MIDVAPTGQTCGALVKGVDLTKADSDQIAQVRKAWLAHQVVCVTGSPRASVDQFTAFARAFGPFGDDPYLPYMPGHAPVVELRREPDETSTIFADTWHSDWSFQTTPPAATLLYGVEIPPVGGDTLFTNLYAAYDALPSDLGREVEGRKAIHSAVLGYSKQGAYGANDSGRSFQIKTDDAAWETQTHSIVRVHPETGRKALFVSPGYTIGVEGMGDEEARDLLGRLFLHMDNPEFVYRHRWSPESLLIWDNRCVNHKATGGYEGHRRRLYRITIADDSQAAA